MIQRQLVACSFKGLCWENDALTDFLRISRIKSTATRWLGDDLCILLTFIRVGFLIGFCGVFTDSSEFGTWTTVRPPFCQHKG